MLKVGDKVTLHGIPGIIRIKYDACNDSFSFYIRTDKWGDVRRVEQIEDWYNDPFVQKYKEENMLDKLRLLEFSDSYDGNGNISESWHFAYDAKKTFIHCKTTLDPSGYRTRAASRFSGDASHKELDMIHEELKNGGFDKFKMAYLSKELAIEQPSMSCQICRGSGERVMFNSVVPCDCVLADAK